MVTYLFEIIILKPFRMQYRFRIHKKTAGNVVKVME
jgi:hypothetical protein